MQNVPKLLSFETDEDVLSVYRKPHSIVLAKAVTKTSQTLTIDEVKVWNFIALRSNGDGTISFMLNSQKVTLTVSLKDTESLKIIFYLLKENGLKIDDMIFFTGLLTDDFLQTYRNSGYPWADAEFGDTFIGASPGKKSVLSTRSFLRKRLMRPYPPPLWITNGTVRSYRLPMKAVRGHMSISRDPKALRGPKVNKESRGLPDRPVLKETRGRLALLDRKDQPVPRENKAPRVPQDPAEYRGRQGIPGPPDQQDHGGLKEIPE